MDDIMQENQKNIMDRKLNNLFLYS